MKHICVSTLTLIGSDNDLSPGWRQAIICTNAGILLIGPLGIHLNEILIKINTFSFKKMNLKMSSAKWRLSRSQCLMRIICPYRSFTSILQLDTNVSVMAPDPLSWRAILARLACGFVSSS